MRIEKQWSDSPKHQKGRRSSPNKTSILTWYLLMFRMQALSDI